MSTHYVVVHVDDDGVPWVHGTPAGRAFTSEASAVRYRNAVEAELEQDRDLAGGGAGMVSVERIEGGFAQPAPPRPPLRVVA